VRTVAAVIVRVRVGVVTPPVQLLKDQSVKAGAVTDNVPPTGTWQLPAMQTAPGVVEVGVIFVPAGPPVRVMVTVTRLTQFALPSQTMPAPQVLPGLLLPVS
jgi:hypothetical protein